MSDNSKKLIVIVGPTAVGKTALSIKLAKELHTEIISADSRQFYRSLDIGTAKPTFQEMNAVPHHFIDNKDISEDYNSTDFEKEVLELLDQKFQKLDTMIMVGGSGLYIQAVCSGFDKNIPKADPLIRKRLDQIYQEKGIEALQDLLKGLDNELYEQMDIQNKNRLIRAIEVCETSGKKFSELRKGEYDSRDFDCIKIGLELPREELYHRINQRVEKMLDEGLEDEAMKVWEFRDKNALKTVGYQEFFEFFEGQITKEKAIEKIKTNSRRYAKRQITWFKKDKDINWFSPMDIHKIINFIHAKS